ncbi:hypothetical protein EDD16DRAFT_1667426 [Pisolithus croceorrhizus]|nr:hypothetical protein EDD16DRAFT_1667426 [Pisolithus croceorrhizus]
MSIHSRACNLLTALLCAINRQLCRIHDQGYSVTSRRVVSWNPSLQWLGSLPAGIYVRKSPITAVCEDVGKGKNISREGVSCSGKGNVGKCISAVRYWRKY